MHEDRAITLLKAVLEILNKCEEGPHIKDVFGETAFYDGAECDGSCLKDDIESFLADIAYPSTR